MRLTDRRTLNRLLDIISDSLRELNDLELEFLLDGKGKLGFISTSGTHSGSDADQDLMIEVKQVAERLGKIETREAARELFASIDRPRKRDFLVRVAQASDVRTSTKDSIAKIEHKLIEATVGLKLRSKAFKEVSFR